MKWVVLRDDDANGLTDPARLDHLYAPFLSRGMPVHLAVIPEVRTDARALDGSIEGFLAGQRVGSPGTAPIADNRALVSYVRGERGYRVLQHGLHHEIVAGRFEFDRDDAGDLAWRLDRGRARLRDARLVPVGFVAPQDRLSRAAVRQVSRRFGIVSTGWFDLGRVPRRHWPRYLFTKKVRRRPHWRSGRCAFFTHPGCLMSPQRSSDDPVGALRDGEITVLVLHHWEAFEGDRPAPLAQRFHDLAERLAHTPDVRVVDLETAASRI